jgi:hypothetical protein
MNPGYSSYQTSQLTSDNYLILDKQIDISPLDIKTKTLWF